jgi:cystathionine beta-lyase/cystathionine gamma-synthase
MSGSFKDIHTKVIHSGEPEPRIGGAVTMPIFQTAMFERADETGYDDIPYIRLNNTPNQRAVADKLAALENAEAAVVTSSGMAAISTALLTVLGVGDHILVQDCLYGGTHYLVTEDFASFGIEYDFVDGADPASWQSKVRPNTRAIYLETISNPVLKVPDISRAVAFARDHGLISMIDNTFASPVNFRPAEVGMDLSLHSATKFLNGHSDIVAGACIGRAELVGKVTHRLNHLGGSLDPHAAFLLHRGIKTLALRVERQNRTAFAMARSLETHPKVSHVHYPGLESHPGHSIAAELFDGFGGMLSFELEGGAESAERFMQSVELPIDTVSLGGVETLITRPALTTHSAMPATDLERLGISEGLMRLSIGIESEAELLADVGRALDRTFS